MTPGTYWYAIGADREVTVFLPGGLYFVGKPAGSRETASTWLKLSNGSTVHFEIADVVAVTSKGA